MNKNVDLFNRAVVQIFSKLYESFPTPITLSSELVLKNKYPNGAQVCANSIQWLEHEGYIRVGRYEVNNLVAVDVVLTEKALVILSATPKFLRKETTFGEYVTHLAKDAAPELIAKAIMHLFKDAIA